MKKALRCIAFLIVMFFVIRTTYDVLSWKDTAEKYVSSTKQLYATDDNLMDVVFLGSSHCYCGIAPDVLWGNYGMAAFNMATSGQDKLSTYHLLKEVLKAQSPKVVCVEMWGLTFDEHAVQGNVYRNMLAMKLSQNSISLVREYVDEGMQLDYILRWPIVHTRYKELDKYDFVQNDINVYGRGVPMSYRVGWASESTEAIVCDEIGDLTDTNREWLENLYQLSIEEEFQLVFFMTPTQLTVENQMQVNAAKEFAKENNIAFFDFNKNAKMVGIDYAQDFLDTSHLNGYGAAKITDYLGKYILDNYPVDDHRGEESYYQWDESYVYYEQTKKAHELDNAASAEEFARKLKEMNNVTYLVSLEGTYDESTLDMKGIAEIFGIGDEEYEAGGTFLYSDGKLKHIIDNDSKEIYIHELNEYDSFKIQNMNLVNPNATSLEDTMLNMKPVGAVYNGLSIVVYDDVRKMLISQKGYY